MLAATVQTKYGGKTKKVTAKGKLGSTRESRGGVTDEI
jgi:hypothetical protein